MSISSIEKKLSEFINNEKTGAQGFADYSLDNMRALLRYFGNPEKRILTAHVAGTNGKGSVVHMLNGILTEAGYACGLYTSPHLQRINERIRIKGREISNPDLVRHCDECITAAKKTGVRPTYFDILTLIAIRYFHEMKVDIAIMETGLGGRLDSTNVVIPLVSVLTDISKDHTGLLGNTIAKIAAEKAGIIKPGIPVITSNTQRESLNVIRDAARAMHADLYVVAPDRIGVSEDTGDTKTIKFDFSFEDFELADIRITAPGAFQAINASLAIAASRILSKSGFAVSENAIRRGIKNVKIPGRFAILSRRPGVIFDPAHNPSAIASLCKTLKDMYGSARFIAVTGFMIDKDYTAMTRILVRDLGAQLIYFELDDRRALTFGEYKRKTTEIAGADVKGYIDVDALADSLRASADDDTVVIITGSFRMYTAAKKAAAILRQSRSGRQEQTRAHK